MKNKLNRNYKPNKIRLELMNKLMLIDRFAEEGLLYIDEERNLLAIRDVLFIAVCTSEKRFRAFLSNIRLWMCYERTRREVSRFSTQQLSEMKEIPPPSEEPFDINVVGKKGKCVVVGKFDGTTLTIMPYEESKKGTENLQESFTE